MAKVASNEILPLLEGASGAAISERFWAKVDKRGPDDCWEWTASQTRLGYGRFKFASYKMTHASRFALIDSSRREYLGLACLHSCDNPPCCNPAHLRWGTIAENSADAVARGRTYNGKQDGFNNGACKLTPDDLAGIIEGFRRGLNNKQIARGYDIHHSAVSAIRVGKTFRKEAAKLGWEPKPQFVRRAA